MPTIKIKAVSNENKGKYNMLEVVYGDDRGETKTKKIASFANPQVYDTLKNAKSGESFDITQSKDDKGYWQWTSVTAAGSDAGAGAPSKVPTMGSKSTYETADERARRQVLIVKQSCLAQAIEFAKLRGDATADEENIQDIANTFVQWVFDIPVPAEQELGDIPF